MERQPHGAPAPSGPATPAPDLPLESAVASILGALSREPAEGRGIAVLYAFASDRMRAAVGDEAAFGRAFRNSLYQPLIGHGSARTVGLERRGDAARVTVEVRPPGGGAVRFLLALARARHGERRGCWLVSGLAREGVDL